MLQKEYSDVAVALLQRNRVVHTMGTQLMCEQIPEKGN
jgi:hypothetical protein